MSTIRQLFNFTAFQAGWFACVLSAAAGRPWIGFLVVLAVVVIHLGLTRWAGGELRLILSAMILGLFVDTLLLASGWVSYPPISYPAGLGLENLAPYWIISMWALFATTINFSLGWLRGRLMLAVILGAAGGPLSYVAGTKLGAMQLLEPVSAVMALAGAWGLAMPALILLAKHFTGHDDKVRPDYIQEDWRASRHA